MSALNIFKIKKEERWLVIVMLIVFIAFNALLIYSHYKVYTMGAHGGFWTIFTKNFRMSGYDNWSWITISGMRIHFETIRHPLYLTFLYPLYLLNHWLIGAVGYNFAVYFMAAIIVFSATYATVFMYRVLREVIELKRFDATLLTVMLFSFAHVLVPTMVPDHFVISLMLLTMTLYIVGIKMKKGRMLTAWQSFILLFFTSGMAVSNGAKTILAGLFCNKWRHFFTFKYLFIGIILPLLLLFGIRQAQYYALEVPQKAVIHNIEVKNKKKNAAKANKYVSDREAWLKSHTGKTAGDNALLKLIDTSTPREKTIVENFFGEGFQQHEQYLLKDVSWDRPVFVPYSHTFNYVVEGIIVLLFALGIVVGYRKRFFLLLLSWFACDILLNIVLGFGINEVYIMTAGWAFIVPIAYGYLLKGLPHKPQRWLRIALLVLTAYLALYNGIQIILYLL